MVNDPNFAPWNDPDAEPIVDIRGVTKRFGDFTAIDDLSLKIYPREFFAILGPSGCGKTTLMRMLGGFDMPSAGEIYLYGKPLADTPPGKRPVNMMFQSYALFPHLTVWDNIAFGLKREKMPKADIESRVGEMLDLVQLRDFTKRKPHQLSGGQRQRVALARSLAKKPALLLLDEPLGALDKKLREETQFELMGIQESLGTTFVIVTHDQEEAMTVASRIAIMREGRIAQVAPPQEIYEAPASRYVADFIADVNMFEGRLESAGPDRTLLHRGEDGAPLEIDSRPDAPVEPGETGWLAVRPERMSIAPSGEGGDVNALNGKVVDIAYLGNTSTYHVELPDGQVVKVQRANRGNRGRIEFTWDDPVTVSFARDAGVLLDR